MVKFKFLLVLALAQGAAALAAGLLGQPQPADRPKQVEGKPVRTDRFGDPLPPGAIARLGTQRLRHGSAVHSIEFAPAGHVLASAGDDAVRIWDAATGRQLQRLPQGAHSVAFSPDGRLLATGGLDRAVRLWDAATGRPLRQFEPGGDIYTLAIAPDGKTLASGGRLGVIYLDDVATGKRLHQCKVPGRLASVAFSPDSKLLASATTGGVVQVWDLATRTENPRFRDRKLTGIHVAFSPDGRLLASAPPSGGQGGLWEVASGKEVRRETRGYPDIAFAPDGRTLAAPDVNAIYLWQTATGKQVAALPWRQGLPARVRFSPDGKYLAAAGGGGPAITVWDLATRKEVTPLREHRDPIAAVALAPDRRTLAAVAPGRRGPGAITLWDIATRRELRRLPWAGGRFSAVLFAAAGRELIAGPDGDGVVCRWETGTGKELPFELKRPGQRAGMLAVSSDGQALAVLSPAGLVHIYDRRSRTLRHTLRIQVGEGYVLLALSPGGRLLAYWDAGFAVLMDSVSGKALHKFRLEAVSALAFSPDGQLLATGGSGLVRLWAVATGKERPGFAGHGDPGRTTAVAFSADGRSLASSGSDGTIRVWEVATGGQRLLFQPAQPAACLAFCLDGKVLASGSFDTTVLLWDLTGRVAGARPGERLRAGEATAGHLGR
jgi:WD40 repeat protein